MTAEWKKYTGSDEQIAEIRNPTNLVIFEYIGGMGADNAIYNYRGCDMALIDNRLSTGAVKAYLICQPHPLADMICQQARTGQPVYVRYNDKAEQDNEEFHEHIRRLRLAYPEGFSTNTPYWFNPYFEYRFTPFEEEA